MAPLPASCTLPIRARTSRFDVQLAARRPLQHLSLIRTIASARFPLVGPKSRSAELTKSIPERRRSTPRYYRKNLLPVAYVLGDVAGEEETQVYAIEKMNQAIGEFPRARVVIRLRCTTPHCPRKPIDLSMKWDGEWHITIEVFRDLGPGLCRRAGSDLRAWSSAGSVPSSPRW